MYTKMIIRSLIGQNGRFMGTASPLPSASDHSLKEVLVEEFNDKALFTINRPKALNAANYEMLSRFEEAIREWKDTKSLIIIKGSGEKAFSAGGDLLALAGSSKSRVLDTFKTSYTSNYLVGKLKIPLVALIDGITMGGGVGIAVNGRYRIATERTTLAMPEAAFGFFPDVGASYFLPRLQGKLGHYLGLTGFRLKGKDVLHAGLATHYCESSKIPVLEKVLLELPDVKDIDDVINYFCPKSDSEFSLGKHLDQINDCFNASEIEEIMSKLAKDNSDWAKQTIKKLRMSSPTSLKVVLRQLNLGSNYTLGECLQMEYRLAAHFMEDSDFQEGVRTLLVAKDKIPKWNPARIEDVTEARVLSFFEPLPDNDRLPIET